MVPDVNILLLTDAVTAVFTLVAMIRSKRICEIVRLGFLWVHLDLQNHRVPYEKHWVGEGESRLM